jgi:hypothetical protein
MTFETISMGVPEREANVAACRRRISKRLDNLRYPNLNKIQTFFKDA